MQLAETRWLFSLSGLSRANQFLIEQKYWREFIEVTTLRICSCDQRTQDKARSRLLGIAFCYRYFPFLSERPCCSRHLVPVRVWIILKITALISKEWRKHCSFPPPCIRENRKKSEDLYAMESPQKYRAID